MSSAIPPRSVGDKVRVMQTDTAKKRGVAGIQGVVTWISEREIIKGWGRRCLIEREDGEIDELVDECMLASCYQSPKKEKPSRQSPPGKS